MGILMIPLPHFLKLIHYSFSITFLFSIGLRTPHLESIVKSHDFRLIGRALLLNLLFMPLVGLSLIHFFPMPADVALGFMLIAITPGGLFGVHFAHLAKGNIAFAMKLAFSLALASMLIIPVTTTLFLPTTVSKKILDLDIFLEIFLFAFLPFAAGQLLQFKWENFAQKLGKIMALLAPLFFIGVEILAYQLREFSIAAIGPHAIWAFILLVIISWILGWIFGGPEIHHRKVLAIDTSMRNVAICWLVVNKTFVDANVDYAIIAFSGIVAPMNLVFCLATRFLGGSRSKTRS